MKQIPIYLTLFISVVCHTTYAEFDDLLGDDLEESSNGFQIRLGGRLSVDQSSITSNQGTLAFPQSTFPGGELSLAYQTPSLAGELDLRMLMEGYRNLTGFTPDYSTGWSVAGTALVWVRPWSEKSGWMKSLELGGGIAVYNRNHETALPYTLIGSFTEVGFGFGLRTKFTFRKLELSPHLDLAIPGLFFGDAASFGTIRYSVHTRLLARVTYTLTNHLKLGSGVFSSIDLTQYGDGVNRPLDEAADVGIQIGLPIFVEVLW